MEEKKPSPPTFVKPLTTRRIPIIHPVSRDEFTVKIDENKSQRERKAAAAASALLPSSALSTRAARSERSPAGSTTAVTTGDTSTTASTRSVGSSISERGDPSGSSYAGNAPPRATEASSVKTPSTNHPAVSPAAAPASVAKSASYRGFRAPTEDDDGRDIEWAFDVYARPFVPEAVTRINKLAGLVVETPAAKQINFGNYASSSLPERFLPIIPKPAKPPSGAVFDAHDPVDPRKYEQFFTYLIEKEIEAEKRENDICALFCHEVTVVVKGHYPDAVCIFTVPGLRENTPRLYEDDIVQLRQLRYDERGRFLGTATGHKQFPSGTEYDPMPWTGKIYYGRVARVQLQQEILTVRVHGLNFQSLALPRSTTHNRDSVSVKFNIQFMASTERNLPMQHVLPVIQKSLDDAGSVSHYDEVATDETADMVRYFWYQSMLFPIDTDCDIQENLHPGVFDNPFFDQELNWEQKKAVQSVCQQNYGSLPYLISGPPGTGKTKTIIETALQLLVNVDKVNHILLCAPSDPAADTLIDRLRKYLNPSEMLRLNKPTRTFEEIPGEVLPYCYTVSNMFCLPPFPDLMKYRVVVTTCRDAALLMYGRMTNMDLFAAEYGLRNAVHPHERIKSVNLHWNALLMDEAAQALEPEALIAMSIIAPPLKCPRLDFIPLVVMAGDQCQLGPHTFLPKTPLKTSLFARLFSRSVYADHPLARGSKGQEPPPLSNGMLPILRPAFTNLIRNYRSHPAILAVPSSLFYHDTLICEAPIAKQNRLADWGGWQGKAWPVLFHANPFRDEIERDGGGWYNTAEVEIASLYAKAFIHYGVAQKDICIMSPFKAQVRLLRKKMRDPTFGNYYDVNIGPTEAFQGLEKGVVILCTTRSKPRFVEKDIERDWGIVGLPNKMNVAMTRAQYGLVIVGKRDVLRLDPHWEAVLAFCDRNGLKAGKEDESGGEPLPSSSHPRDGDRAPKQFPATRLERQLLGYGGGWADEGRVLRGMTLMDEMWANSSGYDRLYPGDADS